MTVSINFPSGLFASYPCVSGKFCCSWNIRTKGHSAVSRVILRSYFVHSNPYCTQICTLLCKCTHPITQIYTLAFSCHYASVRCCHRASPYARAAPHTRTKTIRCQQDMRLGQGPSSFDCDPHEPFNLHRKALYICKILFVSSGQCLHKNPAPVTQLHTPVSFSCFRLDGIYPHAGRGHVTSRNGPGFFVRSFEFLGTGLYIPRGKNLCKPHFTWVIWTILAKNGTLSEVLKILEATENLKFCPLNYYRMRKCESLRKSHVRCCSLVY